MRAVALLGLAGLAGCDLVFGTQPVTDRDAAMHDDAPLPPPPTDANIAFVSSKLFKPGELGGILGADAKCQDMAGQAGLTGTFKAWLSDSTTNAIQQLRDKRGWVRRDSLPFVDTLQELAQAHVLYPLRMTEAGLDLGANGDDSSLRVVTGTSATGVPGPGAHCNNYTSTNGTITAGFADAGFAAWTSSGPDISCGDDVHIYCFGVDHATQVSVTPETTRRAFVSSGMTAGNMTLNMLDIICKTEGQMFPGGPGNYLAAVTTGGMSARARFGSRTDPWVRFDGVTVFAGDGSQVAPLDLDASGASQVVSVWTGTASFTQTSNTANCGNWSTPSLSANGIVGANTRSSQAGFSANSAISCQTPEHVYCLEM